MQDLTGEMPYRSLQVEGITYFYNSSDTVIPGAMLYSDKNWAKDDIDNFVHIADRMFYKNLAVSSPSQASFFLDVGGNIGITSIYCKLKLKPELHFIAFEPVQENATLFMINNVINGIERDIKVEKIALSNETTCN